MKPRKPIRRSSKRIRSRGKRRFKGRENKAYRELVLATYPCEVWGLEVLPGVRHSCAGALEFAHIQGKALGGYDVANGVSLCTKAHTGAAWSIHRGAESFAQRFGIDLAERAREIARELGYLPDEALF